MTNAASIWIITDPSKSGEVSLSLTIDRTRIDDPLERWPTEVTIGPECKFTLAGDKASREVVYRLSRAHGDFEILRCELSMPNLGKFDGHFTVKATDDLFLGKFSIRQWTAILEPSKLGAVRFRPSRRSKA